ncbi:MAG: DUF2911 domain-containing protein [Pyrinomonadaceae bacterium]
MKRLLAIKLSILLLLLNASAQIQFPRLSPKAELKQTIGDTTVSISYGRPSIREREVWGKIVPFGEVWRTGANEATVFEISGDAMIAGSKLPRGKYSLHTIPGQDEWTIIFNKVWDQWGSFDYEEKDDALRIRVKPRVENRSVETLHFSIEEVSVTAAEVVIAWEKLRIPFKIDVGDVLGRTFDKSRSLMISDPINSASFVFIAKLKDRYTEAIKWLDNSNNVSESFAAYSLKAQMLAELGRKEEAIRSGEKAVEVSAGTGSNMQVENFRVTLEKWKAEK